MSKPIIEVKDYSYRYASTEELVLKNITFTVNEGDFVGVVGCNRAGKSTLCKSIVGILPFVSGGDWSGEIVIDGKSLNDTKGNGTTDVVGIVFQDAESQFTQQTVEDEIAFAMCNFGYERNQMRERVKFAAEACGLMGMLDRSPYHLSGGQQQRLPEGIGNPYPLGVNLLVVLGADAAQGVFRRGDHLLHCFAHRFAKNHFLADVFPKHTVAGLVCCTGAAVCLIRFFQLGDAAPATIHGPRGQFLTVIKQDHVNAGTGIGLFHSGSLLFRAVFVFDEPTIGLHPRDVETLLQVFDALIAKGATVVVIEHDLDVIRSADCIIDMGPGGGEEGGRIVVCGTQDDVRKCPESVTGKFI